MTHASSPHTKLKYTSSQEGAKRRGAYMAPNFQKFNALLKSGGRSIPQVDLVNKYVVTTRPTQNYDI